MLTIYKTDSEKVYSAEYVFNQRLPVIKRMTDVLMPTLKVFGYDWDGKYVHSAFGAAQLTDVKIACKLAVCLQLFSGLLFDTYGVSESDIYKVLSVNTGRLLIKLDTPLRRLMPLQASTDSGVSINTTTELNVYLFG